MPAVFDSDVSVTVEIGFGSGPLAASPVWSDVSAFVAAAEWTRGRPSTQSDFAAGSGRLTLANQDGRFYPFDTGSPYFPNMKVGAPVRILATHNAAQYSLFRGFLGDMSAAFPTGTDETVEIPIIETVERLNRATLTDAFAEAAASTRVADILDAAGWPAALRDIDATAAQAAALTANASPLALLRDTAFAEQGEVFQTAAGAVRFAGRLHASGGLAAAAVFGPVAPDLIYVDVKVEYNDSQTFTEAAITGAAGAEQTYTDTAAADDLGVLTFQTASGTIATANDAANVAQWFVNKSKDLRPRIVGLQIDPAGDPANLWPEVLDRDLLDPLQVTVKFPGASVSLVQDVVVEQISHRFAAGDRWAVAYGLRPLSEIETNEFWIVGTSRLDVSTRLA